ncbi:hypothetical protein NVP2275O_387 [Vibrio phage 2.275.O._10N.286.54.E11]|nr:hypothetical protein NVP2275O_387 [Vibrio phage 2.275.O._10N.286.54.E11]
MKLDEVFALTPNQKQRMDEAPYGLGAKAKDKAVGGLKGLFGSGQEQQGNQEAGAKANSLMKQFKQYVGRVAGSGKKTIDVQHLFDFLEGKGINSSFVEEFQSGDEITPKQAEGIMLQAARNTFRRSNPAQAPLQRKGQPVASTTDHKEPEVKKPKTPSVDSILDSIHALSEDDLQELLSKL